MSVFGSCWLLEKSKGVNRQWQEKKNSTVNRSFSIKSCVCTRNIYWCMLLIGPVVCENSCRQLHTHTHTHKTNTYAQPNAYSPCRLVSGSDNGLTLLSLQPSREHRQSVTIYYISESVCNESWSPSVSFGIMTWRTIWNNCWTTTCGRHPATFLQDLVCCIIICAKRGAISPHKSLKAWCVPC